MWQVILKNKAIEALDYMKKYETKDFDNVVKELQEVEKIWWNYDKFKSIWQWIKRTRVWRWRILCSYDWLDILVRIIAMEKDTQKDYNQRKSYILQEIKKLK